MKVISLAVLFLAAVAVKADADCGCTGTTTVYAAGEGSFDGKKGATCTNKNELTAVTKCSGPDDTFSSVEWDGKLERTGDKSTVTTACLFEKGEETDVELTCTKPDGTTSDVTKKVKLPVGCKCKTLGGKGQGKAKKDELVAKWKEAKGDKEAVKALKKELKDTLTPEQLEELKKKVEERKAAKAEAKADAEAEAAADDTD